MKKLIYLFFITFIVSCNTNTSTSTLPPADTIIPGILPDTAVAADENYPDKKDTLTIDLGPVRIGFIGMEIYPNDDKSGKDTATLYPEIGESLDSQLVYIDHSGIKDFSVTEQFQTTLSVMNEGPHIELYDWKSYTSSPSQLIKVSDHVYMMRSIPEEEAEKFPEFTKEELINYVNKAAGESWGNLIKNPSAGTWKDQFWIGVGVRIISVSGILPSGEKLKKTILIYPAMGC